MAGCLSFPLAPDKSELRRAFQKSQSHGGIFVKDTYMAKAGDVERKWYIVDAEGKTVGRLAAAIANVLRGKNKPVFTPHVDTGDFVIVINAEKIVFTCARKSTSTTPATSAAANTRRPANGCKSSPNASSNTRLKACCPKTNSAQICSGNCTSSRATNTPTPRRNPKNSKSKRAKER